MGHYHRIVNLSQHAVIEPTDVGVLDKLLEFGLSPGTAMAAVWLLLARESWYGDRIAILGYEGRPGDLGPDVVAETGVDGTAYYDPTFAAAGAMARDVLVERGISTFSSSTSQGVKLWRAHASDEVTPAGVDVVAVNMDRKELLDPTQFGDSRDLHLSAATGGFGGVTTALALVLAASNRGGGRGGGDFHSCHPVVGSWAGDRVGVAPVGFAQGMTDVSGVVRSELASSGDAGYDVTGARVIRALPPWMARAAPTDPS